MSGATLDVLGTTLSTASVAALYFFTSNPIPLRTVLLMGARINFPGGCRQTCELDLVARHAFAQQYTAHCASMLACPLSLQGGRAQRRCTPSSSSCGGR